MGRIQKKIHYIYKTTCSVNGKYYIGMHSTDNMEDGYLGSGKRLRNSINYYGKENHIKEIIEFCENRDELRKREGEIVNEQLLNDDKCINLRVGGKGWPGKGFKIGGDNCLAVNKYWKDNPDKKFKQLSDKAKKQWENPDYRKIMTESLGFKNKKHVEETKKKMSDKAKERVGDKNSQYGTCWITNGVENKKIKKEEIIPDGWYKGRQIKLLNT